MTMKSKAPVPGREGHPDTWRVSGHRGQMVDMSTDGPLGPAEDDDGVNTCVRKRWPDAPGFSGGGDASECESGGPSGAFDGSARIREAG